MLGSNGSKEYLSYVTGNITPIKGQSGIEIRVENVCIHYRVVVAGIPDNVIICLDLLESNEINLDFGN